MKAFFVLLLAQYLGGHVLAEVKLAKIFGNNMILQRNKPIPVWGWANAGEKVTIQFNRQEKQTKAAKNGRWQIELAGEAAGGPYQLVAAGKNKVIISNILVGEVWMCSGQSNMEMTVASSLNADTEIRNADFPQIRHIKVPTTISANLADDLTSGEWQIATPATAGNFTGVGFFFARKLYQELKIPVGIINASWGGTMVETWISRKTLESTEDFRDIFTQVPYNDVEARNEKQFRDIVSQIESEQGSIADISSTGDWKTGAFDHSQWKKLALPADFDKSGLAKFDGTIWFRKTVELDKTAASNPATINLSTIDDADETYINGTRVGSSNAYNIVRQYTIPPGLLKEGKNVIAIRVTDAGGNGGFFGKASELNLSCSNQMIPLAGDWHYKIEAVKKNAVNPNAYPSLLFNSMINPMLPFGIRGVLWYQGETNTDRSFQYRTSFPLLINDWREHFKQGDFPFYFVQLASYSAAHGNSSTGSGWAELREAQTRTLSLPNTGMAATLDIGESNDIHPKNKQDVGLRLAAIALSQFYDKPVEYAGPTFQAVRIEGPKAILRFKHADSGYLIKDKYGYIRGFEIAGADKKFYFARAFIQNNEIVVDCEAVPLPVAVRYGWADDMLEANLYNKQGFPAVSFRTDTWQGITDHAKYAVAR